MLTNNPPTATKAHRRRCAGRASWRRRRFNLRSFPAPAPIEPERDRAIHRFSVTQLINYQRCPRQYYFDRVLHAPAPDALAVWNDAEAPEPPANLTATLKGAVIHRFCETYSTGDNPETLLRRSFDEVVRSRQAQLADRLVEINADEGLAELLPLAQNYFSSAVFERVERARAALSTPAIWVGRTTVFESSRSGRSLERTRFSFAPAAGNPDGRN